MDNFWGEKRPIIGNSRNDSQHRANDLRRLSIFDLTKTPLQFSRAWILGKQCVSALSKSRSFRYSIFLAVLRMGGASWVSLLLMLEKCGAIFVLRKFGKAVKRGRRAFIC